MIVSPLTEPQPELVALRRANYLSAGLIVPQFIPHLAATLLIKGSVGEGYHAVV